MAVKTITAEIDGKVRKITADIPDDARPDEIEAAVRQHLASTPDPLGGYKEGDSQSIIGHRLETAPSPKLLPYAVDQIVSPITGLASVPGEIANFVKSGFKAPAIGQNGRLGAPDYMRENPVSDAVGGTAAALLSARGTPKPNVAEVPPEGPGGGSSIINGMRNLYSLWKTAKKLSPSSLAERGFEAFLDHMDGKTPEAPPPASPAPPAEAPVQAPPQQPTPRGTVIPISGPDAPAAPTVSPTLPPTLAKSPTVAPEPYTFTPEEALKPSSTWNGLDAFTKKGWIKHWKSDGLDVPPELEGKVEPITKANIRPKVQSIAEQLRDSMAESGSLPTETPEGISGKAYEADARGTKAEVVAKALHENGISYKDASSLMEVSDWKKLFTDLGQKEPGASTGDPSPTIQHTLLKLKKLYDAEKPAATPKPNIRRRK